MSLAHEEAGSESVVYEDLADANNVGSRPLGLIDPSHLTDALQDGATITLEVDDQPVPVLVSIDYAYGYATQRCHEIVGEDDPSKVLYYSLPAQLGNAALSAALAEELGQRRYGYIFYDAVQAEMPPMLADALERTTHDYSELPLWDNEAEPGNEQASIALYGFDFPVERPDEVVNNPSLQGVYDLYAASVESGKYSYDTDNGAVMIKGGEIDDELFDKLWDIYQDRFQWLGEKHPVSMEDTKSSFNELLRNDNTLASIYFSDGQPMCFTYLSEGPESVYWLNDDFLGDREKMHMRETQTLLFIPGIVSGEVGAGYSMHVLGLLSSVAMDYNGDFKVIFENTNRSERYIPRVTRDIINGLGRAQAAWPEVLDRTVYGCVRFGERPTDED